jgi:hypothetical protein
MPSRRPMAIAILTIVAAVCGAATQADASTVRGRLVKQTPKGPIPAEGIAVTLLSPSAGRSATSYSDRDGMYYLFNVPPGVWYLCIRVSASSQQEYSIQVSSQEFIDITPISLETTARTESGVSALPLPVSNSEKVITEAHKRLHIIRGDHVAVHLVANNPSMLLAAKMAVHDASAPTLASLDSISASDLSNLSSVWQMLYFETRSALEFYLACSSQSRGDRIEKAKASVVDGEKAIGLLGWIATKNDPADAWLLEDQKKQIVQWYQAAAEGIVFEETQDPHAKDAAVVFWNKIDPYFRQAHPPGPESHLAGIVSGAPLIARGDLLPDAPGWQRLVGFGFAFSAGVVLMALVRYLPPKAGRILVFFPVLFFLTVSAFIAIRRSVPFFSDRPLVVGALGGLVVLIVVILVEKRHGVGRAGLQ